VRDEPETEGFGAGAVWMDPRGGWNFFEVKTDAAEIFSYPDKGTRIDGIHD
jgi:hypothetical protein